MASTTQKSIKHIQINEQKWPKKVHLFECLTWWSYSGTTFFFDQRLCQLATMGKTHWVQIFYYGYIELRLLSSSLTSKNHCPAFLCQWVLAIFFIRYGMLSKGDEETWNIMLQRYMDETNAQEKVKLLKGLAWIDQPWVLMQFIRLAKNETIVRSQDFLVCLRYISLNPIGTPIVYVLN